MDTVSSLLSALVEDPWRATVGFSDDVRLANDAMLQSDGAQAVPALQAWLQRYQPCLFGRLAAKYELLSYCVLTERDLLEPDAIIQKKIQDARTQWTHDAFLGKKHGFIIAAVSPRIVTATPNETLLKLARRLCSLYLLEDVQPDAIYTDEIFLEFPDSKKSTWRWPVGINYFCTNGDKRWWQDHRVPGGMVFSMNSVGHMAKTGMLSGKMNELSALLSLEKGFVDSKVDSLPRALEFAMRTIYGASEANSGKATWLLPLDEKEPSTVAKCPIALPKLLENYDHCEYAGFYHTDVSIPSEYFIPGVERPGHTAIRTLDFTYLFDDSLDNPDYLTTGMGRRIRSSERDSRGFSKKDKVRGERVPIDDCPRLCQALEGI